MDLVEQQLDGEGAWAIQASSCGTASPASHGLPVPGCRTCCWQRLVASSIGEIVARVFGDAAIRAQEIAEGRRLGTEEKLSWWLVIRVNDL